jgi:Flp pilus assembly protein TadG
MDTKDKEIGQTLIETVFVLALLLILIFGIAEFARAWYLKNSLNNAARIGARVAVVQSSIPFPTANGNCVDTPPAGTKAVLDAVCLDATGVNAADRDVTVVIFIDDEDSDGTTSAGDLVTVKVTVVFTSGRFSVFSSLIPGLSSLAELSSQASMRYELS